MSYNYYEQGRQSRRDHPQRRAPSQRLESPANRHYSIDRAGVVEDQGGRTAGALSSPRNQLEIQRSEIYPRHAAVAYDHSTPSTRRDHRDLEPAHGYYYIDRIAEEANPGEPTEIFMSKPIGRQQAGRQSSDATDAPARARGTMRRPGGSGYPDSDDSLDYDSDSDARSGNYHRHRRTREANSRSVAENPKYWESNEVPGL
ncbi:hypothetical protein BDV19DRAFT_385286 [Aspergillus venezuelensis]